MLPIKCVSSVPVSQEITIDKGRYGVLSEEFVDDQSILLSGGFVLANTNVQGLFDRITFNYPEIRMNSFCSFSYDYAQKLDRFLEANGVNDAWYTEREPTFLVETSSGWLAGLTWPDPECGGTVVYTIKDSQESRDTAIQLFTILERQNEFDSGSMDRMDAWTRKYLQYSLKTKESLLPESSKASAAVPIEEAVAARQLITPSVSSSFSITHLDAGLTSMSDALGKMRLLD